MRFLDRLKSVLSNPFFAIPISALLYVLAFAPWSLSLLIFISLTPVLFCLDQEVFYSSLKKRLWAGISIAALICFGGFYWVIHAVHQYGELPLPIALLVFLGFCLIGQMHLPVILILRPYLKSRVPVQVFPMVSAVFYVAVEWLSHKVFTDTAGHAFSDSLYFRQAADLVGVYGLTFFVVWVNEGFVLGLKGNHPRTLMLNLGIIAGLFSYGVLRVDTWERIPLQARVQVAAIQANIKDSLKMASERGNQSAQEEVIDRYLRFSQDALQKNPNLDLIVWPETAFPFLYQAHRTGAPTLLEKKLLDFRASSASAMAFGGYDQDALGQDYNSIFFIAANGSMDFTYHKHVLLMFGETLPFVDWFPSMRSWFSNMGFFGKGPGPEVYEYFMKDRKFRVSPSICYEGLVPDHFTKVMKDRPDFFLNVTNDSWFGPYGEPYLHLALTLFRSIETRTPFVRVTNTGISTWVDPLGNLMQAISPGQEGAFVFDVDLKKNDRKTLYVALSEIWGAEFFPRFCFLMMASFLLWRRFRSRTS